MVEPTPLTRQRMIDEPLRPVAGRQAAIIQPPRRHAHFAQILFRLSGIVRVERFLPCAMRALQGFGKWPRRSEEHTSELQSLMRISYAVFCLKKKNTSNNQ